MLQEALNTKRKPIQPHRINIRGIGQKMNQKYDYNAWKDRPTAELVDERPARTDRYREYCR